MNKVLILIFKTTVFLLFCMLLIYIGKDVKLNDQKLLIEGLLTVSSVILAIIGIWLAIVFPQIITRIFKNEGNGENVQLLRQSRKLLAPLLITSFIVVAIIIYRTVDVLPGDDMLFGSKELVQGLNFCFISIVSILLIYSLLMSITPGLQFYFDAKNKDQSDKNITDLINK